MLIIEDSPPDRELLLHQLKRADFSPVHACAESAEEFRECLTQRDWEIVIADCGVSSFGPMQALAVLQELGLDVPLVAVSGTMGEETAVEIMRAGARDLLPKNNLARLGAVVHRELRETIMRLEQKRDLEQLKENEERFRAAFQNCTIGMGLVSLDDRWLMVNRALSEMLGYSETELLRMSFQEMSYGEDLKAETPLRSQLISGSIRNYQLEKRFFNRDRRMVWALLTMTLVRGADNQPLYLLAQIQELLTMQGEELGPHDSGFDNDPRR